VLGRLSLRARLLLAVLALATVGLLAADIATYSSLSSFLIDRTDSSLRDTAHSISQPGGDLGTRIAPRTVCTALSPSRIGSVIHSSHATGRMWLSPSISRPVATLVAIMQNASCGVRTWIACQLRFKTKTVALFNTLLINFL